MAACGKAERKLGPRCSKNPLGGIYIAIRKTKCKSVVVLSNKSIPHHSRTITLRRRQKEAARPC